MDDEERGLGFVGRWCLVVWKSQEDYSRWLGGYGSWRGVCRIKVMESGQGED